MSLTDDPSEVPAEDVSRASAMYRLRNYFLTGLVIAAPLFLTVYITWAFVEWIDGLVVPLIPPVYRLNRYLPIPVPGFGLIVALVFITLLGFLAPRFLVRRTIALGEYFLRRMPFVRNIYNALKQMFETVVARRTKAFQRVALMQYPRPGVWALVFIATETRGEVDQHLSDPGDEAVSVFLPTTPNPIFGFLLFVKRRDLVMLEMTVEEGIKMVLSAGLVSPETANERAAAAALAQPPRRRRKVKQFTPPSAA
jgi:uncharacterized membrane protein